MLSYGDGWMPNRGDFLARIPELQRLAAEAGRGPIPVSAYGQPTRDQIESFIRAGVERAIYYVPSNDRDSASVLKSNMSGSGLLLCSPGSQTNCRTSVPCAA